MCALALMKAARPVPIR